MTRVGSQRHNNKKINKVLFTVHKCFFVAQAYPSQRPSASYTTDWGRNGDAPHDTVPICTCTNAQPLNREWYCMLLSQARD